MINETPPIPRSIQKTGLSRRDFLRLGGLTVLLSVLAKKGITIPESKSDESKSINAFTIPLAEALKNRPDMSSLPAYEELRSRFAPEVWETSKLICFENPSSDDWVRIKFTDKREPDPDDKLLPPKTNNVIAIRFNNKGLSLGMLNIRVTTLEPGQAISQKRRIRPNEPNRKPSAYLEPIIGFLTIEPTTEQSDKKSVFLIVPQYVEPKMTDLAKSPFSQT